MKVSCPEAYDTLASSNRYLCATGMLLASAGVPKESPVLEKLREAVKAVRIAREALEELGVVRGML